MQFSKRTKHMSVCLNNLENMSRARKEASDGKTTVKRAMEIIELALPIFVTAWSKSQEKVELNEEVMNALYAFEESRHAVSEAGLDIDLRTQKTEEFSNHLGMLNYAVYVYMFWYLNDIVVGLCFLQWQFSFIYMHIIGFYVI